MAPPNWPALIVEGGFPTSAPVQPPGTLLLDDPVNGKLDTATLGGSPTWQDLTAWARSGSVTRAASRSQGPLWDYQPGQGSVVLKNGDGRFDPANLSGPYVSGGVTYLNAMVPLRFSAGWNGTTYRLFTGFVDSWDDDGVNYAGHYAQTTVTATDGQKVLAGIILPLSGGAVGAGELSGARVNRILDNSSWYTGTEKRVVGAGNSRLQAYAGQSAGTTDTAWNLLKLAADSEIGELYVNGAGAVVFRGRQQILTDTRSNTPQAVFGDLIGTAQLNGNELAYFSAPSIRDDATLANDITATVTGGSQQEAKDAASIATYMFPRFFSRSDLILQGDLDALSWAQWILYVSKFNEDRFDTIAIKPLRDPANLWPQALGREIGDRIQVWRRPPGVSPPVTRDVFIRGIAHRWDITANDWTTTFTLQDAAKYGSFFTLDNPTLGRLNYNALAF